MELAFVGKARKRTTANPVYTSRILRKTLAEGPARFHQISLQASLTRGYLSFPGVSLCISPLIESQGKALSQKNSAASPPERKVATPGETSKEVPLREAKPLDMSSNDPNIC